MSKRERNKCKRVFGVKQIGLLGKDGHNIHKLTEYHYRIDGYFDYFPTNSKWHNIESNTRGECCPKKLKEMLGSEKSVHHMGVKITKMG